MVESNEEKMWDNQHLEWELQKVGPLHTSFKTPWRMEIAAIKDKMSIDILEINQQDAKQNLTPFIEALKFFYVKDGTFKFDGRVFSLSFPVTDNRTSVKYMLYLFAAMRPGGEVLVAHSEKAFATRVTYSSLYSRKFIQTLAKVIELGKDNDTDGIDNQRNINLLAGCLAYALMSCYSEHLERGLVSYFGYTLDPLPGFLYYAMS